MIPTFRVSDPAAHTLAAVGNMLATDAPADNLTKWRRVSGKPRFDERL
jgi:hypothetical protein